MTEIDGYRVVPLRKSSSDVNCSSIYMKEHFIRLMDPSKPKGRTLFLLNVPPYVTEKSLETFFNKTGTVLFVTFAEKPGKDETSKWINGVHDFTNKQSPFKFKVAYVVFKTTNSLQRALQVTSIDLFNEDTGKEIIVSGMQLWHLEYQNKFFVLVETQQYIDQYIADYDAKERIAELAAKSSEADADGWVTVGKRGKNSGFEQKDTVIDKLEEKLKRSKKKELTNFYTFQIRESKMKNIIELRKKFEDDKRKIDTLKQTRRFKPF